MRDVLLVVVEELLRVERLFGLFDERPRLNTLVSDASQSEGTCIESEKGARVSRHRKAISCICMDCLFTIFELPCESLKLQRSNRD